MANVMFAEGRTSYFGRKEKVAIVLLGGREISVGLADTARCAVDLDVAKRVLTAFAGIAGVPAGSVAGAEHELQAHCRALTKWKERKPRY